MIVSYHAVFDLLNIIVFQLVERIAIAEKSIKSVLGCCIDMLGFSYNAIPTRHEVPSKPYLQEENYYREKPTKLSNIADMANESKIEYKYECLSAVAMRSTWGYLLCGA